MLLVAVLEEKRINIKTGYFRRLLLFRMHATREGSRWMSKDH